MIDSVRSYHNSSNRNSNCSFTLIIFFSTMETKKNQENVLEKSTEGSPRWYGLPSKFKLLLTTPLQRSHIKDGVGGG